MLSNLSVGLIPGTQCDNQLWSLLIPYFPKEITPLHIPIERESCVPDMVNKIAEYTADKANLIGFSLGGYLALDYALENPQKVRSLILIASNIEGLPQKEKSLRLKVLKYLSDNPYQGMSLTRVQEFLHPRSYEEEKVVNIILDMDKRLGHQVLTNQLKATTHRTSLLSKLKQLSCPILIIGGEQDKIVDEGQYRRMKQELPRGNFSMLPNCGHMIPLEQPEVLASTILNFYQNIRM